jgi:hypothetical protein
VQVTYEIDMDKIQTMNFLPEAAGTLSTLYLRERGAELLLVIGILFVNLHKCDLTSWGTPICSTENKKFLEELMTPTFLHGFQCIL